MANSATVGMTVGAVLGTVGTAAGAVTSTIDAAVDGIVMLDRYVKKASREQARRYVAEAEDFEAALQEEIAMKMAERKHIVIEYCSKSELHARLYQEAYDRIGKILADTKGK
jgi:predicted amino acid dehydrogenase